MRQLPKSLIACIEPPLWGHVAEWLRNGLQNRVLRFNSGRGLHQYNQWLAWIIGSFFAPELSRPRRGSQKLSLA
jgi:hypothetical protein